MSDPQAFADSNDATPVAPGPALPPQPVSANRRTLLHIASIIAFLLLASVGLMASRPLYGKLKAWHGRARATESLRLTAEGKLQEAAVKAREAYILSNSEPMALRAMGTVLAAHGDHRSALEWWKLLMGSSRATDSDRLADADAALRTGDFQEADTQLAILLSHNDRSAEHHRLASRCRLARNDHAGALAAARHAVELEPANEQGQLFLGALLFDSKATHKEGVQRLRALAALKNQTGLEALMALAADRDASLETMQWIATGLLAHPLAGAFHHVHALRLELACRPEEKQSLLEKAQTRLAASSPEVLREFATLLFNLREPKRLLAILPLERAIQDPEFFKLHLDALATLRRWSDILVILEMENLPLSKPLVPLYQARCETELGNVIPARALWNAAIRAAGDDTALLLAMSDYATRIGNYEQAIHAQKRAEETRSLATGPAPDNAGTELRRKQLGSEFIASSQEVEDRRKKLQTEFTVTNSEAEERKKRLDTEFTANSAEIEARRKQRGPDVAPTTSEIEERKKALGIEPASR